MRHDLNCHPDTPAAFVESVHVELAMTDSDDMLLTFYITPGAALAVPDPTSPGRADGLWQRTCCELFLKPEGGESYFEFNLSPSGQWAAYAFDGYRAGMRNLALPVDPHIELERQGAVFVLEADVDLAAIPAGRLTISLSAVVEEADGTKSYWALNHPPGKPDFHHPDGFVLALPAGSQGWV
ncbi:DOMON-like domain-containing protein [Sphingomonas sp. BT-65]|uniref:DOMON-like domain-containing protein n=1 Tax=Sphingomonas sp. BT-65 TaxID=2989821 RepID=UPI0022357D33|nr:DOMON-like domain-containing protein [Sphingomonas sp. BT-65]MCW4461367.1 DOMON-like domain-containing protein [Sphingomonas sp. BT-65]